MMRAMLIGLALSIALAGCGTKGRLKSPSQIEAEKEKKERRAEKKAEKAAKKQEETPAPSKEEE